MREIRLSGSEGGGTGYSTGPPYPYQQICLDGALAFPDQLSLLACDPGRCFRMVGFAERARTVLMSSSCKGLLRLP